MLKLTGVRFGEAFGPTKKNDREHISGHAPKRQRPRFYMSIQIFFFSVDTYLQCLHLLNVLR